MSVTIHKSSYIDPRVTIGMGCQIWHFCHFLTGTIVGKNCSFGQNCMVGPDVTIGDGVKVQNNVSIYKGVRIESDVFIGPSVVFTNILNPRSFIDRRDQFQETLVKRGATIGANATIICGVVIGQYALIGAGAVVKYSIPDFALVVGIPAKQIGWVSKRGNSLEFDCNHIAIDREDGRRYQLKDGVVEQV